MELPKNVVQIGNPDKHYKIFVEDYVISYMKQINRSLRGGQAGIALYGKKYVENEARYYFLYGASEINGLEDRGAYLSDLEREQIEYKRAEFFEEEEFLAWCTLTGEMPDGFFLLEQGKGLLINGYATFFEKNDNMLNFMIIMGNRENGKQRAGHENHEAGRRDADYEWGRLAEGGNIDHRLLERNQKLSEVRKNRESYRRSITSPRRVDKYERNATWKTLLTGVAVMLCVIGIATLSDEEKMKDIQAAARQIMENINEQKLPDAEVEALENIAIQTGTQTDAALQQQETETQSQIPSEPQIESQTEQEPEQEPEQESEPQSEIEAETRPAEETASVDVETEAVQTEAVQTEAVTVTYVVKEGDMLLTICRNRYGSDERVKEICELNGIENPDDIKVGQIILLPE